MLFQSAPIAGRPTASPELGCDNRAEIEARSFSCGECFEGGASDRLSGGIDIAVGVQRVLPHRSAPYRIGSIWRPARARVPSRSSRRNATMSSATSTVSRSVAVPRIFCARRRVSGSNQNSFRTLPSRVGRRSGVLGARFFIRMKIPHHPYDLQPGSGRGTRRSPGPLRRTGRTGQRPASEATRARKRRSVSAPCRNSLCIWAWSTVE
jgi:hypothetical protein